MKILHDNGKIKITKEIEEEILPDEIDLKINDLTNRKNKLENELNKINEQISIYNDFKNNNEKLFIRNNLDVIDVISTGNNKK